MFFKTPDDNERMDCVVITGHRSFDQPLFKQPKNRPVVDFAAEGSQWSCLFRTERNITKVSTIGFLRVVYRPFDELAVSRSDMAIEGNL